MRQRRGARDRRPAERRAVVPGREPAGGPFVCEHRPDRQAVGQRLGQRDDIGPHAEPSQTRTASGPPHAALHLVEDQQRAALVAEPARLCKKLRRGGVHPAFALHRLDDECRHLAIVDRGLERADVVEGE